MIHLYTDGSCDNVFTKKGGWGYVIINGKRQFLNSGKEKKTTNNRMEMTAVIKGLQDVYSRGFKDTQVAVHSDSALIVNSMTKNWERRTNRDLWHEIELLHIQFYNKGIRLLWKKVKAHSGDEFNELADRLARYNVV